MRPVALRGITRPLYGPLRLQEKLLVNHRRFNSSKSAASFSFPLGPLGSDAPTNRPSSSFTPSFVNTRFKRNAVIGVLVAVGSVWMYLDFKRNAALSQLAAVGTTSETRQLTDEQFKLDVKSRNGVEEHRFYRKTDSSAEATLKFHESVNMVGREGNPVVRWDRNWVESNEPNEDRSAVDIIPGAGAREGEKDLMMVSVLDGHGGSATSELLRTALHPTLAVGLAGLRAGILPGGDKGWLRGVSDTLNPLKWLSGSIYSPENVCLAIRSSFLNLDDNIINTPLRILKSLPPQSSDPKAPASQEVLDFDKIVAPANHGAVAISSVIDVENDDLYVAVTGDCRAIAGWQGKDGKWRCDVLSEDQEGENPKEVTRIKAEHPLNERDMVIRNGRVQGGLQPTRAFGDAIYKWKTEESLEIAKAVKPAGTTLRKPRAGNNTPPYVTARPEVVHRKIHPTNGDKLRFMILATDGLWDRISSEEAALLTASYLTHPTHYPLPKTALAQQISFSAPTQPRLHPVEALPGTGDKKEGMWCFEGDRCAATHLIRNALSADKKKRAELLSITGKVRRWFRDDITVTVLFFDDQ